MPAADSRGEIDDLALRLRTLAQGGDTLSVAQFQFLGLEKVAAAYGERWPAQKVRIQAIAEEFLQRRIDGGDLLIKAAGGFLMVFGSRKGEEAQAAASSLSHGLNEFFLGDIENTPAPNIGVATHAVGLKDLVECLGDAARVVPVLAPSEPVESAGLPDIEWRYQPVWDVRRETLSSWYVTPYLKKSMSRAPGYLFENTAPPAVRFAAIDEASLWVSEQALHDLRQQDKQALIGVSLHVSSLTNLSTRQRLLSAIDRLDRQYFRYRLVKIAGVPPGFPRLYLDEIVGFLRSRISNVVIGAAWNEPDMSGLLASGPVAVGVALPATVIGPQATVQMPAVVRKLEADLQIAHAAHMRFYVEGQIDHGLAKQLARTGIDNICSPRIWPAGGSPDGMMKWPATGLAA